MNSLRKRFRRACPVILQRAVRKDQGWTNRHILRNALRTKVRWTRLQSDWRRLHRVAAKSVSREYRLAPSGRSTLSDFGLDLVEFVVVSFRGLPRLNGRDGT